LVKAMRDKADKPAGEADARAERLAKALRANLARRKGQARARAAARQEPEEAPGDAQKPQERDT